MSAASALSIKNPDQNWGDRLPSKQPVVGSNPTGGVFQISCRAMDRFRDELGKIPETAPLDSPVVLSLSDALTLARVLLQKFR